jgi:hypothetical protein
MLLQSDSAGHIGGYGLNGWLASGLTVCMLLLVGRVHGAEGQAPAVKAGAAKAV